MTPELFLQLCDVLPEPTLLVSGDGLVLAANLAAGRRIGLTAEAIRGQPLSNLVAEPAGEAGRYLRSCSRSREMMPGSLTVTAAGQPVPCRAEGAVIRPRTEDGEALVLLRLIPKQCGAGSFAILNRRIDDLGREIHLRKAAEEAVRRQEERLRVTLASIGDAVMATDVEGRVVFLNGVAEALTGWPTTEAAGRPLPEVFRIVNEHTRHPVENPALRALREGVVVGLANHTILVARDGAERPIDDSAAPIRDETGGSVGAVLVFRDVTERKQAEEALARLAAIVESSDDAIISKTLDGIIRTWNAGAERLFGYSSEEAVGRPITLIIPPDRQSEETMILGRIRRGERIEHFETVRQARDGRLIDISITVSPVRDAGGVVAGASKVARDITDRKRLDETLRDASRKKDDFIALLAHELRNPLAPIRNGLQVIRLARPDAPEVASARAMMDRQLSHMVRLIDDLLDVSRITRNKMELRRARVRISDVVASAAETARPVIEEAGHELFVSFPGQPVFLDADLTRLSQVFGNLLTNSARYTPRGGRIWLSVSREDKTVVVTVRDNGIGIPAESLSNIFDMFSQVDRSIERSTGGLGIGLALVRGLVEMHGGTVTAESGGTGKGSMFTVTLPTLGEQTVAARLAEDAPAGSKARRRILVADDNRDGAESLSMMLELLGNEVATAHDGLEAVERAGHFRPEVILMDIGMPRLNGLEATKRLREQPWGRTMTIIALTGWGQEADRERSREAGCDGHLVKPVDLPDLEKLLADFRGGEGG